MTTTQISNFDYSEYNTDAKILDQFLSNGFPRSIIASRFFHETDKTFDELVEDFTFSYPQLDADGRVAIGVTSMGQQSVVYWISRIPPRMCLL